MIIAGMKQAIQRLLGAAGYRITRVPIANASLPPVPSDPAVPIASDPASYDADGLTVRHKQVPFLSNPRFIAAYRRAMESGHPFGHDLHIEWRIAVACWAGIHASKLPGDFVECGVCTGMVSLAVCDYVDFNRTGKTFYLIDTFRGVPEEQVEPDHLATVRRFNAQFYERDNYERACANFRAFPRASVIRGTVPDILPSLGIGAISYLHLDMNTAYPERAAIEYLWPKLSPGAFVLLDDYGWHGHERQASALDEFARNTGVEILSLPTGQGLLAKPN